MKSIAAVAAIVALGLTIVPAFLVVTGTIPWQTHAHLMTAGMILWFVAAPLWMKKK